MRFIFLISLLVVLTSCDDIRTENFPNGKIKKETVYVEGKKNGIEKEYFENGNIKIESPYVNDRKEGVVKEFYEDGILKSETPYVEGYIEGEVKRYHSNGKLAFSAVYKKNKQVEFGTHLDSEGAPETHGSYKDPRDGYAYEWVLIGSQYWTAENINFATATGSLCAQCNVWGRLYNFETAQTACLEGFRLPSKEDWLELLKTVGDKPGLKLKAGHGWNPLKGTTEYGNGKDDFGFAAKASGIHQAKSDVEIKQRKFEGAGEYSAFWTSDGTVLKFFYNNDNYKFEKFNPEFGASLRCVKN